MRRYILLLACLSAAGCVPPYLAVLDSSAALTRQMTVVGNLGPINVQSNGTNIRFLPMKPTATSIAGLNLQSGFAIDEENGYDYVRFAYVDSNGQAQVTGSLPFSLAGADPNYPLNQFEVTTTTATGNIVVLSMYPTAASNTSVLCTATLSSGPLAAPITTLLNVPFGNSVLGVHVSPQLGAADSFNFLLWNGGSAFSEGSTVVNSALTSVFLAATPTTNAALSLPTTPPQRYLYYKNQAGTLSYASHFTGSQWVCYQWAPSGPASQLGGVTHRIDAILTTGDLLSTEGGILRLYGPAGNQVLSVSLGGLQFCYEAYLGSTPYVFFSLVMNMQRGDWMFRVYAIPTSSMRGLGG